MATVTNTDSIETTVAASEDRGLQEDTSGKSSHGQILKSSALVGGSSLINIGIGIVRTKAMAMLLGPAGFGLFGIYNSIISISQTVAGMGVNSSGVREIAKNVNSGDEEEIARTTEVLRKISLFLGLLGGLLTFVFSGPISSVTFGNREHVADIKLLSIAVFLMIVSAGQGALIQGMRRITDLAKMNTLGPMAATMFSIPLVYLFRERGVVIALITVAAMTLVMSWWFSRRIELKPVAVSLRVGLEDTSNLLKLGFAFMSSSLMTMGIAYIIRLMLLRNAGFRAAGLYQSAWTLGGLYVGFILQAMGADFYPRLTAAAKDHKVCNRLVNEQTEIGVLLAGPGVIATLVFAQIVIAIFYSTKFLEAVPVLRWLCLAMFLQVITWPIGFIVIAKGRQKLFFACEASWATVSLLLAKLCIGAYGLVGAGVAFFGSYVFHGLMVYGVGRQLTGFAWSRRNVKKIGMYVILIGGVFWALYALPSWIALSIGVAALTFACVYSIRSLVDLVAFNRNHPIFMRFSTIYNNFSRRRSTGI